MGIHALSKPLLFRLSEMTKRPEAAKALIPAVALIKEEVANLTKVRNFTVKEREEVEQMCDDAEKWLQEKEAEQAEIPGHEDAAFTAKDVVKKWEAIEKKLKILRRKPFLIPKVKKSKASKKSNSTATPEEG